MSEATKRCPYCNEEILAAARKCKHCKEWLEDPPTTTTSIRNPETLVREALNENYEIEKELGRGGMAIVYKAKQRSLGRDIALKVLPQGVSHDKKMLERFHREARSAARLNHPHIVTIIDEGETNGVHFMAMEYLSGRDLHEMIQEDGRLPCDEAVSIITPIADALAYAHKKDMIHRDVKGSNVMITDIGRPVLMDFGIAYASSEARLTQTGTVLGTPEYMSPEQARGTEVEPRSDLYSLGVVLYEAITGELPHSGGHPMSVVYKVLHEPYKPPRQIRPEIPEWLEQVVAKCLMKDVDDRFSSCDDLAEALRNQDPGEYVDIPTPSDGSESAPEAGPIRLGDEGGSGDQPAQTQIFQSKDVPDDGSTASPDTGAAAPASGTQRQNLSIVRSLEGTADWVNAVSFSPDGQYALGGGSDGEAKVWEVVSGDDVQTINGLDGHPIAVDLSSDGSMLLTLTSESTLQLWDLETGALHHNLETSPNSVLTACFSPDGNRVLGGAGQGGTLRIWDVKSGEPEYTFDEHEEPVFSAAFSPDGSRIVTGTGQGALRIWDVKSGGQVMELDTSDWNAAYVFSVAFSPDGQYVLSGSDDMTARLWDASSGKLLRTFDRHEGLVIAVSFSPDGQFAISGTSNLNVCLWKVEDGSLGYLFEGESGEGVSAIDFSPDGRYVLSGTKERGIRMWTP